MGTNTFKLLSKPSFFRDVPKLVFRLSVAAPRQLHNLRVPYEPLPSYDMISRRFSSDVHLRTHSINKRIQKAGAGDQLLDIHDVGGVDPEDFDILITDLNDEKLRTGVAKKAGMPYLSKATEEEANAVADVGHCFIWGRKLRTIFPTVVSDGTQHRWVFFIVDTGSPLTYLSVQSSDVFGIPEDRIGATPLKIAGRNSPVHRSPEHLHFTEVNLLGIDFFNLHDVSQWNQFKTSTAKLYFGSEKWDIGKK